MFAVRGGQRGGGGKSVDDEDSKWEVTNTYFASITQTKINLSKTDLVKKLMLYYFSSALLESGHII